MSSRPQPVTCNLAWRNSICGAGWLNATRQFTEKSFQTHTNKISINELAHHSFPDLGINLYVATCKNFIWHWKKAFNFPSLHFLIPSSFILNKLQNYRKNISQKNFMGKKKFILTTFWEAGQNITRIIRDFTKANLLPQALKEYKWSGFSFVLLNGTYNILLNKWSSTWWSQFSFKDLYPHTDMCGCTYIKSFSIIFNLIYTHPKMFNVITLEW